MTRPATKIKFVDEDDAPPGESTPLLATSIGSNTTTPTGTGGGGGGGGGDGTDTEDKRQLMLSFRRKSYAKLVSRQPSQRRLSIGDVEGGGGGVDVAGIGIIAELELGDDDDIPMAHPVEGLAPLFPNGGIREFDGRGFIPYREPSLVKSTPAYAPYRRMARHRSFYLWWTNEFRHWWKSSRLLVRLAGLYVYSYDPVMAPTILLLDPEKNKSMKKLLKFSKHLGQGGPVSDFLNTVKPFTRSMRMLVGTWRWFEASPCRREEVGVEEFMAFVGNRVSRMVARTTVDDLAFYIIFPIQRYLFKQDILPYPAAYHPIAICVCIGFVRAISPFAASFQGSRFGRVVTRRYFSSSRNRWLPTQRIEDLNLRSDDCQERDEVNQTADLVIIARVVATALGEVQTNGNRANASRKSVVRQHEALLKEGFKQVGAGSGGYAVYQYIFHTTTVLLHVTPYGPSIADIMPYYLVLEFETSCDFRQKIWSNSMASLDIGQRRWQGPQVLEGYCYQGAFFSPHHFAELKEMYDNQLLAYEAACKKLPVRAKKIRQSGVPNDLPTLKKFLEAGKRNRKRKKNIREYNELQKVVKSVAKEIINLMKKEKKKQYGGHSFAPKGVILYFEGLDCSGKSSTGGLVQSALEQAGYDVSMRQYNRPPTAAQRSRPWMDRFEIPGDSSSIALSLDTPDINSDRKERMAIVWDRGPAGDFVYGNLNELSPAEKKARYEEFIAFDLQCREKGILFLKLLFVTNRDSIAKTLGKRLAQKKMAMDLTAWLQACRSRGEEKDITFEGLDAIKAHIDPTDFTAFNNYERNLRIFSNFALNTDSRQNPWLVVNTGDRYAARKSLMKSFRSYLHDFSSSDQGCSPCSKRKIVPTHSRGMDINEMMKAKFARSSRQSLLAWIAFMCLLLLVYIYAENNKWDDSWFHIPVKYNITSLLEDGNEDNTGPGPIKAGDATGKDGKTSKKDGNANESVVEDAIPGADGSSPRTKAAKNTKEDEKETGRKTQKNFDKKGNK